MKKGEQKSSRKILSKYRKKLLRRGFAQRDPKKNLESLMVYYMNEDTKL